MPKTQPEADLATLRRHAEQLWDAQQQVFSAAGVVAREAGQHAAHTGAGAVRSAYDRVAPAAAGAIATAAAIGDQAARAVLGRIAALRGAPVVEVVAPPKRRIGVGGWIGIAVGVAATAAVAYVVWQTLRADDDLWIEEEELAEAELEALAESAEDAAQD